MSGHGRGRNYEGRIMKDEGRKWRELWMMKVADPM
jgi:hypothetical protein